MKTKEPYNQEEFDSRVIPVIDLQKELKNGIKYQEYAWGAYNWFGYVTKYPEYTTGKEARLRADTLGEAVQMFKDLYNLV